MRRHKRLALQLVALLAAAGCLFYGIQRGEIKIVRNKAVNVCLECIGLG